MSTRLTRLASLRNSKQKVVKLLFSETYSGKGHEAHRKLVDSSSYTYTELRNAYLQRIQEIHPDKHHRHSSIATTTANKEEDHFNDNDVSNRPIDINIMHDKFVELSDAWDQYESIVRMMMKSKTTTSSSDAATGADQNYEDANFTMFGVGCSFSDSTEERELRSEITDQACRGWFSSGEIAKGEDKQIRNQGGKEQQQKKHQVSLCDDDMFVETTTTRVEQPTADEHINNSGGDGCRRRSLVDDAMVRRKRT